MTPEQFKEKTIKSSEIIDEQYRITSNLEIDAKTQGTKSSKTLEDIKEKLLKGTLNVLIMGTFDAGKSTLLNALMGKSILPTKPIPSTAVISEIVYAEESEAILFPKKGQNAKVTEAPIAIKVEDLDKYILINHEETNEDEKKKENPYEKVIVKYPLSICENGVRLVDSPGLNDPTCHDEITLTYLPAADAIIYCMPSMGAFTAYDRTEIEHLRALGYKSIIFVMTFFDILEQQDSLTGGNAAEETCKHYTKVLAPYTDLGKEGIFFVSSLNALIGKIKNNAEMLKSSHFPEMEEKLEHILFSERGSLKLIRTLYSVREINRNTNQYLADRIALYKTDRNSLASNLQTAQLNLNKAQEKAKSISENFQKGSNAIIDGTKDNARLFFVEKILPNIEKWINECEPANGISMLHPKQTGIEYAETCMKYLQRKIEITIGSWCQKELVPNYISPRIQTLIKQQDASLEIYENDLQSIRGNLSLSMETGGPEISTTNRIASAIVGMLAGPSCAIVGGSLGWEGMLPAFLSRLAIAAILCLNPVSFPLTIIILFVTTLLGGSSFGTQNIGNKMKKKLSAKAKEELIKQQEAFIESITESVKSVIDDMNDAVEEKLNAPVNSYQKLLDDAKKECDTKGSSMTSQIEKMSAMLIENKSIARKIEDFEHDINIAL